MNAPTLSIELPMRLRRRGGRKTIVTPDGQERTAAPSAESANNPLVAALVRAYRWQKLLDTGVHDTVRDIARAEHLAFSYVSRHVRLTLLAPDIVEDILADRQPESLMLQDLLRPLPVLWPEQRKALGWEKGLPDQHR